MKFSQGSFILPPLQMKIDSEQVAELESLKLLEAKIGSILDRHEEVRREKEALARQLKDREAQFVQLSGQVKQYEQERRDLKTRLEKILNRLNGLDIA